MKKDNKGISLIILVITIIALAILAGIVVLTVTDGNLISYASQTVTENDVKNISQAADIAYKNLMIENFGNSKGITEELIKEKVIEYGVREKQLKNIDFEIGEEIKVGLKTSSSTVQNPVDSIINYKIFGNSVQNGTPTPSTPVEIQSVGDRTTNLFDKANTTYGQGTLWSTSNGNLWPSDEHYASPKISVKENTVYTRTNTNTSGNIYWDKDGKYLSYDTNGTKINVPEGAKYVSFNIVNSIDPSTVQLNEGNKLLDYEPYGYKIPIAITSSSKTQTKFVIYLDEPLRKIGDFSDYIDFSSKKVYRKINKTILDGTGTYISSDNLLTNTYRAYKPIPDAKVYNPVLCDKLTAIVSGTSSNDTENIQFSDKNLFIRINRDRLASQNINAAKEYLSANHITVYYVLATPIEESIDLPTISASSGTTTITIDTDVSPSNMELFYQYN